MTLTPYQFSVVYACCILFGTIVIMPLLLLPYLVRIWITDEQGFRVFDDLFFVPAKEVKKCVNTLRNCQSLNARQDKQSPIAVLETAVEVNHKFAFAFLLAFVLFITGNTWAFFFLTNIYQVKGADSCSAAVRFFESGLCIKADYLCYLAVDRTTVYSCQGQESNSTHVDLLCYQSLLPCFGSRNLYNALGIIPGLYTGAGLFTAFVFSIVLLCRHTKPSSRSVAHSKSRRLLRLLNHRFSPFIAVIFSLSVVAMESAFPAIGGLHSVQLQSPELLTINLFFIIIVLTLSGVLLGFVVRVSPRNNHNTVKDDRTLSECVVVTDDERGALSALVKEHVQLCLLQERSRLTVGSKEDHEIHSLTIEESAV